MSVNQNIPDSYQKFLDEFGEVEYTTCGVRHPKLENECVLLFDHEENHEDAAGNQWFGFPTD